MEISTVEKIEELKKEGPASLCSIWISEEMEDDRTFDVNVWDEIANEREESLEEAYIPTYEEAKKTLIRIVEENPDITFVRLSDSKYDM